MRTISLFPGRVDGLQFAARGLALLWAGFWTFFCVAAVIFERQTITGGTVHLMPAVVFCAATALAWRSERAGGMVLIGLGIASFVYFRMFNHPVTGTLLMLGPPTVSGILLMLHARR